MKTLLLLLSTLVLSASAAAGPASAADPLRVVATIPDLADIAREIGGDRVSVRSIARGTENMHLVKVRPSDIVAVNKADLFIQMGLSLEHAYVPGLLMTARNKDVEPGRPGFVNCSEGWRAIDVPENPSRGQAADVHPMGNPHFNLHPDGGEHIAKAIHAGLVRVDPDHAAAYDARLAAYLEKIELAKERWKALAETFRGESIVSYHDDFGYLALYYRMPLAHTIESRPGVPPTANDLARVVQGMAKHDVRVILTAKWSNNRHVRFVSEKSGVPILELPTMVGGVKGATTWIGMMDLLHERLAQVFGKG